jgi:hypothetical protein
LEETEHLEAQTKYQVGFDSISLGREENSIWTGIRLQKAVEFVGKSFESSALRLISSQDFEILLFTFVPLNTSPNKHHITTPHHIDLL